MKLLKWFIKLNFDIVMGFIAVILFFFFCSLPLLFFIIFSILGSYIFGSTGQAVCGSLGVYLSIIFIMAAIDGFDFDS